MAGPSPRMVGRADELARLDELLAVAAQGRGRATVVLGEPGIGKTTLVEALAVGAQHHGAQVAWGRCTEAAAPPFWPWRQALSAFADAQATVSDRFDWAAASRPALFARVIDELAAVGQPALVVLEDLHWADPASLALLRFVVDALPGLPMLLVATMRDDPAEASPEATALVGSLPAGVDRLLLSGLAADEVAALVAQVLGTAPDPDLAARISERCGGNPFYAREVARLHAGRGAEAAFAVPLGVRQVLERRLARLGQPCRELLAAAAVAGEPDVELSAELAALPRATVMHGFNEAVTARLLVADGHQWKFTHALVRDTIYETLPATARAELHRRVAKTLERGAREHGVEAVAAQLATHWRHASGADAPANAAAWALRAARDVCSRMGYEQAVRLYRQALDHPPEDALGIRVELGGAQVLAGELEPGRATLREAAREASRSRRFADLARAALGLGAGVGGFEVDVGDEEQLGFLQQALAGLDAAAEPGGERSPLRAAVLARLSLAAAWVGSEADRVAMAEEAVAAARAAGDDRTEVAALAAWCDVRSGPAHLGQRLSRIDDMLAAAQRSGDPASVLLARRFRVVALGERGDFAGFDNEVAAFARTADRLRLPLYAWYVPMWRGTRALMDGDFAATRECIAQVENVGDRAGSANAQLMAMSLRLWLAWFTGDTDGLAAFRRDPVINARDPYVEAGLGALLAKLGEFEQARRSVRRATASGISVAHDAEYLSVLWLLAEGVIQLDEPDAARAVYAALEPYPHCWVVAGIGGGCCGQVAYQLGRLAGYLGRDQPARQYLETALSAHRSAGASLLVGMTETALDELASATGTRAPCPGTSSSAPDPPEPAAGRLPAEGELHRSGWAWQLRWNGTSSTVPDSKGMRDLAVLLAAPERDVSMLELIEAAGGPPAAAAGGHAGERLDRAARTAYRQRLVDLEPELAEAQANADLGRAESLRHEQELLTAELAAAVGLGGRARTDSDPVERARKAVRRRIRTALKAIAKADPALAHHLDRSIHTGRFCAYRPEHPVRWRL